MTELSSLRSEYFVVSVFAFLVSHKLSRTGPKSGTTNVPASKAPSSIQRRSAGKDDGTVKMNLHALESELDQA